MVGEGTDWALAPAECCLMPQVSLVHPAIMFGLLGVSIYTGILGWNYRQARLIPVSLAKHCRTAGHCCSVKRLKCAVARKPSDLMSGIAASCAGRGEGAEGSAAV